MEVTETTMHTAPAGEGKVTCKVTVGGKLSNRKGVNTPSIVLPISPMTPKDRRDLDFILTLSVDWIALSFVQKPEDITELRNLAGNKLKVSIWSRTFYCLFSFLSSVLCLLTILPYFHFNYRSWRSLRSPRRLTI
jgi:pyruvate kinase